MNRIMPTYKPLTPVLICINADIGQVLQSLSDAVIQ